VGGCLSTFFGILNFYIHKATNDIVWDISGVHGRTPHTYDSVDGKDRKEEHLPSSRWVKKGAGDATDLSRYSSL